MSHLEPIRQWQAHGLTCSLRRVAGLGWLAGYVTLPAGHPLEDLAANPFQAHPDGVDVAIPDVTGIGPGVSLRFDDGHVGQHRMSIEVAAALCERIAEHAASLTVPA